MATIDLTTPGPNTAGPAVAGPDLLVPANGAAAVGAAQASPERTGARGFSYIPGLDGIRAIAVLAVLLYHADVSWMPGGFLGVDMFFVLSGFLITSIVLTELDKTGRLDVKRFYLHRARRLLPALFLVLGFAAVLAALFAPDAAAALRRDIVGAFVYVTNWVYIFADQSYFELIGRPPMLQHLWSLAVEEQFYLIWPAVVILAYRLGGRTRVREWALVGAAASTLLMVVLSFLGGYPEPNDGSRVYFGTDTHAMGLLLGAALATVWIPSRLKQTGSGTARWVVDGAGIGSLVLVLLVMMNSHSNATWLYWGGFGVFAALMTVVIAATTYPASALGRALGKQPLRYIGQRSYGLYLWHWPVFVVLRPELDIPITGLGNVILRFAITFGLAELSYRYVEMPIRRGALKRRWQELRNLTREQREPLVKKAVIAGGVTAIVAGLVTFRLVSIPEETAPDYLHGLQSVSAFDEPQGKGGKKAQDGATLDESATPASPTLSDSITAPVAGTVKPGILAVGESVMLGATGGLRDDFKKIAVDAAVGRQASDILDRVEDLRDAGALRETVVLHVGSNGYVERDQLKKILEVLSVASKIVVVNVDVPREWQDPNNALIGELVASTPNAVLADWHTTANTVGDVHVGDGVHLSESGIRAYAQTIQQALDALTAAQDAAAAASPTPVPAQ